MFVELPEFAVIKFTGPESHSFLQGQVTCDVNTLKDSPWKGGAHCNAKGKAWSTFIAFERNSDIFLIVSKESAESSFAEFSKYGVFSKTDISIDTDNWMVLGATDWKADVLEMSGTDLSAQIQLTDGHGLYLLPADETKPAVDDQKTTRDAWWHAEVLSGRAHLFNATVGEYVPQMINLQALGYISFNKGCYMGQEMVARMRYLGKNKRALYIAKYDGEQTLTPGQDVYKEMNGNSRSAGKVINSQIYNGQTAMQLVLNNDTELTQELYLDADCGKMLALLPLPYSLEQD
jgi:tRNA-modifying protein YgfZ